METLVNAGCGCNGPAQNTPLGCTCLPVGRLAAVPHQATDHRSPEHALTLSVPEDHLAQGTPYGVHARIVAVGTFLRPHVLCVHVLHAWLC